jgi:hypothetical protein
MGGVPGEMIPFPVDDEDPNPEDETDWVVCRQNRPTGWNLLNQNWSVQLVPATTDGMPAILQTDPRGMSPVIDIPFDLRLPNLGGLDAAALRRISVH